MLALEPVQDAAVRGVGLSDRIYTLAQGRVTGEIARRDATQELLMQHMAVERS